MSKHHEHRNDLAGEHRLTDIGQLIGAVVFLTVWILDSFVFRFSTFLADIIPPYVLIPVAVILLALAAVMAWISHRIIFVEHRDPPVVITKAFFKYIRHPLYLSEILVYLGLFLLTCSLFSLIVIAGISLFLNYVAGVEERKLVKIFSSQYLDYKKQVGKWIPRIMGRKH